MYIRIVIIGIILLISSVLYADVDGNPAIQKAMVENKYLFIFFYKEHNEKTFRLQKIFDETLVDLGNHVQSIKIKTDNPSEKSLIEKFKLNNSPMPFVLVLSPDGAITGGFPAFTKQQLSNSIYSQGASKCLKALQERKVVLLCLQNQKTLDNEAALKGVKDFKSDPRFAKATEIILIDPADMKENKFLKQLAVNFNSNLAVTVLITPPAVVVEKYQGPTTKDQLLSDLQKATSGCHGVGCCSGNCEVKCR